MAKAFTRAATANEAVDRHPPAALGVGGSRTASRQGGSLDGRPDFDVDALVFRRQLLDAGYEEIPVTSLHALELAGLPLIHRDPFDRLLIAQAMAEGMRLLTADRQIAFYPGPILKV
jgi:hypothetical protein